jgi:hypothetical protein
MINSAFAQVWATATSTNPSNGRVIIFRFIKEFDPNFSRATQPSRVILVWRYNSEHGMPNLVERQRMDAMEDALEPLLEKDHFATLALVSTGENLREWTYYGKSEDGIIALINQALAGKPTFPIEIHTADDPNWTAYEAFRANIRE